MVQSTDADRTKIVENNFITRLNDQNFPIANSTTSFKDCGIEISLAKEIFQSQIESRIIDLAARELKAVNLSFYTIGSAGHEGNAAVSANLEIEDQLYLHYRSLGLMLQRGRILDGNSRIYSHLQAIRASQDDPIASGRHKVFGSFELNTPPQTSTIASHLPKALGAAFSISKAKKLGIRDGALDPNAIVMCSFGDSSFNHGSAQVTLNCAGWIKYHGLQLPLLFVCEDNAIGVSTTTHSGWIESRMKNDQNILYSECDGTNFADVYLKSKNLIKSIRAEKIPGFLHFKTVRLMGHAGSDIETQYLDIESIEKNEANDPLLHSCRIMVNENIYTKDDILDLYNSIKKNVTNLYLDLENEKCLDSKQKIMQSLVPAKKKDIIKADLLSRNKILLDFFEEVIAAKDLVFNLSKAINLALNEQMLLYKNIVIFGEDVGKKGGVYRVTKDLQEKFGLNRVFDSILDEQIILGMAIGMSQNGFLPIVEIQFLAYLHNAIDQIRGEAATLSFFSNGQFANPMIIRLPSFAYQKGFGGHFHNENAIASLREIPGLVLACPADSTKAVGLMRECVRLCVEEQRVVAFLEPIASYFIKEDVSYPEIDYIIKHGDYDVLRYGFKPRILVITYGNGVRLTKSAIANLSDNEAYAICDLVWLSDINYTNLNFLISEFTQVLIVDECRRTGSISEELMANLSFEGTIHRITAEDCFITLGDSWQYLLPSVDSIKEKLLELYN